MIDLFSRYVELQQVKEQEASSILEAFEQGEIYREHGMPSVVLTDKGANMNGQTISQFCQRIGVNKRPNLPQCDGMAK